MKHLKYTDNIKIYKLSKAKVKEFNNTQDKMPVLQIDEEKEVTGYKKYTARLLLELGLKFDLEDEEQKT